MSLIKVQERYYLLHDNNVVLSYSLGAPYLDQLTLGRLVWTSQWTTTKTKKEHCTHTKNVDIMTTVIILYCVWTWRIQSATNDAKRKDESAFGPPKRLKELDSTCVVQNLGSQSGRLSFLHNQFKSDILKKTVVVDRSTMNQLWRTNQNLKKSI